jgi:effector-binding domain-containing protein
VKDIPRFKAATIVYQGDANIAPAYDQVYAWLHAKGYRDVGPAYEIYLSMPGEELRAEVFVPIRKIVKRAAKKPVKRIAKKPVKKAAKKPAKKK